MFLDNTFVLCSTIYVICSKVMFTTNITYVTGIHTFCFYNYRHIFITTEKENLKQNTHFTKTNIGPITGLKCDLLFNLSFCGKI
jgi:hypothetical protein